MKTFLSTLVILLLSASAYTQFTVTPSDSVHQTITSNTSVDEFFGFVNTSDSTETFCISLCSDNLPDDWTGAIEFEGLHYILGTHLVLGDTVCADPVASGDTVWFQVEVYPNGFLGSGCLQFLVWQGNTNFQEKISYCLNYDEQVSAFEEVDPSQPEVYYNAGLEALSLVNCQGYEVRVLGLDGITLKTQKIRSSKDLLPISQQVGNLLIIELVKGEKRITRKISVLN